MKHFYLPWIERGLWVIGVFAKAAEVLFFDRFHINNSEMSNPLHARGND
jgi:hypothetical protein